MNGGPLAGATGEANPYGFVTITKEELEEADNEHAASKAAAPDDAPGQGEGKGTPAAITGPDAADGYINVGNEGQPLTKESFLGHGAAPSAKPIDAQAEGDPLAEPEGKPEWLCEGEAYDENDSDESEDEIETGQHLALLPALGAPWPLHFRSAAWCACCLLETCS